MGREGEKRVAARSVQYARKRPSYRSVVVLGVAWERRARSNESTETINSPARALEERRHPREARVRTTDLSICALSTHSESVESARDNFLIGAI